MCNNICPKSIIGNQIEKLIKLQEYYLKCDAAFSVEISKQILELTKEHNKY